MEFTEHLCIFLMLFGLGQAIDIMGENRKIILKTGDSVNIDCEIDIDVTGYLQHGVSWTKFQKADNQVEDSGVILNAGSQTSQALPQTMKPHIGFTLETNQPINLILNLEDVRPAESGMYLCVIYKDSVDLDELAIEVVVLDAIDELIIYSVDGPDAASMPNSPAESPSDWTNIEDIDLGVTTNTTYIACLSRSSFPPPVMTMTIGENQITNYFNLERDYVTVTGDYLGEKIFSSDRLMATRYFPKNLEDDGKTITCRAVIQDGANQEFSVLETSATLSLNAAPSIVECPDTVQIEMGTKDFELKCKYLAKPTPTLVEWKRDSGEAFRSHEESNPGSHISIMLQADGSNTIAILKFTEVMDEDYQLYTLKVVNSVGRLETTVLLREGQSEVPGATQVAGVNIASFIMVFIMSSLAALVVL